MPVVEGKVADQFPSAGTTAFGWGSKDHHPRSPSLIKILDILETMNWEANNADNLFVIRDRKLAERYTMDWQQLERHPEAYEGRQR